MYILSLSVMAAWFLNYPGPHGGFSSLEVYNVVHYNGFPDYGRGILQRSSRIPSLAS